MIRIVWLYHDLMNLYGDRGNVLTLAHRARARGIDVTITGVSVGDSLKDADIIFFGGGQDQEQDRVSKDLAHKQKAIQSHIEQGKPLLAICGGYQLLGSYYQLADGKKIQGLDVLPMYTKAGKTRMIRDLVISSPYGEIIGFENHSGRTYLTKNAKPLGTVLLGSGNNGEDKTEGVRYKNAIGSYMHGPLLPKNPAIADALLGAALKHQKSADKLEPLKDPFVPLAREQALARAKNRKRHSLGMRS